MPQSSLIDLLLLAMFKTKQPIKETMKKEKSLTNDLFGIELITCPNCNGKGHLEDTAPENATYELYEDCDICKNVGEIVA